MMWRSVHGAAARNNRVLRGETTSVVEPALRGRAAPFPDTHEPRCKPVGYAAYWTCCLRQ